MNRYNTDGASDFLLRRFGLRAKTKTLANWRSAGKGPKYTRAANGQITYTEGDLIDYGEEQLRAGAVSSTTEERSRGVTLPPGGPAARALRGQAA
jgi:hypothetical protein